MLISRILLKPDTSLLNLKMGIFSTSTSASVLPSNPKPSSDGAFEAPNRDARAHCYQARDAFFECLERNSIVDSIREKETVEKVCGDPGKIFDRECAASWVRTYV